MRQGRRRVAITLGHIDQRNRLLHAATMGGAGRLGNQLFPRSRHMLRLPTGRTCMRGALDLDGVTVAFRLADGGTYTAVEGASLSVADGEFVAIVGPTGCGKSTLLNIAAGLLVPAAGAVRKAGVPLAALNRDAGYLFQAD